MPSLPAPPPLVDMQAGQIYLGYPGVNASTMLTPAAVSVHAGSRVNFIACTFRHLGQTALLIDEGSTGSLVANNTFWDASGSAIFLGDVDDANAPPGEQVGGHLGCL